MKMNEVSSNWAQSKPKTYYGYDLKRKRTSLDPEHERRRAYRRNLE